MRNILRCFIIFIFCAYANAQQTNKDFFSYKEEKVLFNFINSKASSNNFNVVIFESKSPDEILKRIKTCTKENKQIASIYYLVIPKEFTEEKDELVLEFLSDILSKRKLVDKEMNIIADGNYFSLYKDKIALTRRYKNGLLNKIEKLSIVKTEDSLCNFLY
ncbi:hypothetical protein ACI6PS_09515 [Flavobacterium sp. PLA-1-15]|uniref:hypothetical protein n=1 Tax=Flavobacterium sp. PLA-1-15 TaxID=3380533 RepID=UPI003B7C9EE9